MDKIFMLKNTITYRYSVFSGLLTAVIAILNLIIQTNSPVLILAFLLLPILAAGGLFLLLSDLIWKTQLPPARINNKVLTTAEILLIGSYIFVSGKILISIIITDNWQNFFENLPIFGIYLALGAVIAALIRIFTYKFYRRS